MEPGKLSLPDNKPVTVDIRHELVICDLCRGIGDIKTVTRTPEEITTVFNPCSSCGGTGRRIKTTNFRPYQNDRRVW